MFDTFVSNAANIMSMQHWTPSAPTTGVQASWAQLTSGTYGSVKHCFLLFNDTPCYDY